ncbi:outer membrane beta-barrel protein [Ectothiorhodospiraceae bacterium WFHF3C12]|nr:outer membrane beta-barrel protein [Ectothiorhodospiraceae bacterium WFHF3C12]
MRASTLSSALAIAIAATGVSGTAMAAEKPWIVRGTMSAMATDNESDSLRRISGTQIRLDNATSLALNASYLFGEYFGVEFATALPYEHDLEGNNRLQGLGVEELADVKQLPATLSLQVHLPTGTAFKPYVGAGVNYTYFYDEDSSVTGLDVDMEDTWGAAGQLGLDVFLEEDLLLNAEARYIQMESTAEFSGAINQDVDMDINPWVFSAGLGYRF